MLNLPKLGKTIYDVKKPSEARRLVVFLARGALHYDKLNGLYAYFQQDETHKKILTKNPFAIEQATRAFFYYRSRLDERLQLIKEHYDFMVDRFKAEWAIRLANEEEFVVWQSELPDVDEWRAQLSFSPGQRKEGLLSIVMNYKGVSLYQVIFWVQKGKDGEFSLYIGAIQGANTANATELIKETTKLSHRYRTKNLILYMLRAVARTAGVGHIYAVSNYGYYAHNHVRRDRKLKTDFGEFWQEAGGKITADERFYELPLIEPRKTMEEVPTRKRAVYRRRFQFLDEVDAAVTANVRKILK